MRLDAGHLRYREDVLAFLRDERRCGRRLILATAANRRVAEAVADHVGLFDAVLASSRDTLLKGERNLHAIRPHAAGPFDYAGDSPADLPSRVILVSPSRPLLARVTAAGNLAKVFSGAGSAPVAARQLAEAAGWRRPLPSCGLWSAHRRIWCDEDGVVLAFGFMDEEEEYLYTEAARRGAVAVLVDLDDTEAAGESKALQVLQRHSPIDLERESQQWRAQGWQGYQKKTGAAAGAQKARAMAEGNTVLPVVEEELKVGKRAVQTGGLRVYSRVTEKPVQAMEGSGT